jgi:hypothetical protein
VESAAQFSAFAKFLAKQPEMRCREEIREVGQSPMIVVHVNSMRLDA